MSDSENIDEIKQKFAEDSMKNQVNDSDKFKISKEKCEE